MACDRSVLTLRDLNKKSLLLLRTEGLLRLQAAKRGEERGREKTWMWGREARKRWVWEGMPRCPSSTDNLPAERQHLRNGHLCHQPPIPWALCVCGYPKLFSFCDGHTCSLFWRAQSAHLWVIFLCMSQPFPNRALACFSPEWLSLLSLSCQRFKRKFKRKWNSWTECLT